MKMKARYIFLIFLGTVAAIGMPALAQAPAVPNGAQLDLECDYDVASCGDYLLGLWDGIALSGLPLFCPSAGAVTGYQLILIYQKFAKNHPEVLNRPRGDVAIAAIAASFPCTKAPSRKPGASRPNPFDQFDN